MSERHAAHKAIVITGFWASVISALLISAIVGGTTTAISAYAQVERLKESTTTLTEDVRGMKSENLPLQITELREQIKAAKEISNRIESKQNRMDDKLDLILQNTHRK